MLPCQFFYKVGHQACQCYHAKDYLCSLLSQPQAHHASFVQSTNTNWVLDTDASHHVINDIQNLFVHAPYDCMDELQLTNGSTLKITHTNSKSLDFPSKTCSLKKFLCVPKAHTNFFYVSKFR